MPAKIPLSQTALWLKNANPQAFDQHCIELQKYEDSLVDQMIQSGTGEVLTAQGRVQSIRAYLRVLKECHLEPKKTPVPEEPVPA
jgi:hypothetical protein